MASHAVYYMHVYYQAADGLNCAYAHQSADVRDWFSIWMVDRPTSLVSHQSQYSTILY